MYASTIFLTQRISREVELWRHMDMNVQTCEDKQPAPETPSTPLHTQYQLSPYNPCCGLVFEIIKTHSDLLLLDPKSTNHVSGNWTMQDWDWRIESAGQPKLIPTRLFRKSILPRLCFCWAKTVEKLNSDLQTKLESTSWIKFADWGTGKQVSSHTICMSIHVYTYMNIYRHSWRDFSAKSTPDLAKVSYTALGLVNFHPFDRLVFTNTRLPWRTVQCLLLFHCDTSPSRKVL